MDCQQANRGRRTEDDGSPKCYWKVTGLTFANNLAHGVMMDAVRKPKGYIRNAFPHEPVHGADGGTPYTTPVDANAAARPVTPAPQMPPGECEVASHPGRNHPVPWAA